MLSNIAFATPWLLGFLITLPVLWWLLRLTPPSPKKVLFPAIALLKGLTGREETPARSPWWLLLLRLAIATLLIIAFAKPLLNPAPASGDKGTLLIAVDNDWAAARDWPSRLQILHDILQKASRDRRQILVLPTTVNAHIDALTLLGPMAPESAENLIDHLKPEAWAADWQQAATLLEHGDRVDAHDAVWIASGLGSHEANRFYETLQRIAATKVYATTSPIYTLTPPVADDDTLSIAVMRVNTDTTQNITIKAVDISGNGVSHWQETFAAGSPRALVKLDMPPELRNQITRFEIEGPRTAASTVLLDASWEHHAVGITGDKAELDRHSLLSEIYYLDRALKPFADVHVDTLDQLLTDNLSVIFMTDTAAIGETVLPKLTAWLEQGGILVRFAGERFANAENHDKEIGLLPVPLRGGRSFGGALSWGTPQKLKDFPSTSPFFHLTAPTEVTINKQVLAEPSADLAAKTWANLEDGTPLVTATNIKQGISILFHVPARSSWSNLPLSGTFVEMLRKILELSRNDHSKINLEAASLSPLSLLDAYGETHSPSPSALPIPSSDVATTTVSAQHPPGLYGTANASIALNLGAAVGQPEGLQSVPTENYVFEHHEIDIQPYLLLAASLFLLIDFIISLKMRGLLRVAALLFAFLFFAHPADAATDSRVAVELTSKPYLGYIRTGDSETDRVSELGLHGLAVMLQRRTALDEVGVAAVNPDTDDLTFFPMLYWPVTVTEQPLSPEGAKRVTHYLRHGGIILFDAVNNENSGRQFLYRVLAGVDMPPLVPLPEKHVLKRSFYLIDTFPGRYADHTFWLEPEESSTYDGVASILYGSNGWASAWAIDNAGRPLFPCTPGGEGQREYAYRFGINLAIYALTGNYKGGQMNAIQILKKMGE